MFKLTLLVFVVSDALIQILLYFCIRFKVNFLDNFQNLENVN